jgi:hypothetical protein
VAQGIGEFVVFLVMLGMLLGKTGLSAPACGDEASTLSISYSHSPALYGVFVWARSRMKAGLGVGRDESDMERLTAGIAYIVGAIAMVSIVVWSIKSMFKAPDEPASTREIAFETGLRRRGDQGVFLTPVGIVLPPSIQF